MKCRQGVPSGTSASWTSDRSATILPRFSAAAQFHIDGKQRIRAIGQPRDFIVPFVKAAADLVPRVQTQAGRDAAGVIPRSPGKVASVSQDRSSISFIRCRTP